MSDTFLVIGGTGNTGQAAIAALAERGASVRALVRDPGRLVGDAATAVAGDLDSPASLERALSGVRAVYLAAPVHEQAVARFERVFEAARAAGVEHVVKLSAQGAAATAPAAILRQHAAADRLLADSGLGHTLLRPNAFFQNLLPQAPVIASAGAFYLPAADARLALIDARDVGEAAASILLDGGHDGATYTLTGPESLDYAEVAATLTGVTGRAITYTPVPADASEQALRDAGLPPWDARAIAEIQAAFASGDWATPTGDLERLLGRAPTRFEAFAREYSGLFGA